MCLVPSLARRRAPQPSRFFCRPVDTAKASVGTVFVDGIPRNDWGMWTDLDPGDYQVCFGDVTGYTTPVCQTATITAGTTNTITGTYN